MFAYYSALLGFLSSSPFVNLKNFKMAEVILNDSPNHDYELQESDLAVAPRWSVFHDIAQRFEEDNDEQEATYYMSPEARDRLVHDSSLSDYDRMLIQRLACRRFHIPGNNFWEDYLFWFENNHPMVAFWRAHALHPLGQKERIVNLLSSLAFGLAATCGVVLWFFYEDKNFDRAIFNLFGLNVSVGMVTLLVFSGPLHVLFDLSVFFLQSCPPCRTGGILEDHLNERYRNVFIWIGGHFAIFIALFAFSLSIHVTLIRASLNEGDGDDSDLATSGEHYSFLLLYVVEIFVANFIVFPIGTFTVFSGVLGCGVLPGIGGRPYQVKKWARLQKQALEKNLHTKSSDEGQGHLPV